jgi:AraC-like DNA-binding protein
MEPFETLDRGVFYFNKAIKTTSSQCTNHYHDSFEIYYLKEGVCNYFIGDAIYTVEPGDIVLIPKGLIHKTNYDKTPHTRLLINCSDDYIPTYLRPQLAEMLYVYRNPSVVREAERILEKIGQEFSSSEPLRDELLLHLCAEFFILLVRNTNNSKKISTGTPFIEETIAHIKNNFSSDISLSDIAKANSVSSEHLSRSFKRETGLGFSEYLNLVRLQKAEHMLKNEPGKSISEIAYLCGFNDSNYFSDKFKKAYGISPSKLKCKLTRKK